MKVTSTIATLQNKLFANEVNKELILDSGFAFLVRIVAAVSSFFMNMVIARQLGAYESGNFFLCFAVITVLATMIRLGGDNLLIRYIGIYSAEKNWSNIQHLVKVLIKRVSILSLIVTFFLVCYHSFIANSVFGKNDLSPVLVWMFVAIPFLGMYTLYSFAFQGLKKIIISVTVQNIIVPLGVTILIMVLKPVNAVAVAELYFAASVVTLFITLILWYFKTPKGEKQTFELPSNFWKSSYALWSNSMLQMAIQWGGQFIAGIFVDQKNLAQLAVCQRTTMLISIILIAVNLVSAPKFASMYNQGKMEELKRYSINSTRLMVVFATPLVLLIWLFPSYIMSLFGHGFEGGVWMLRILALGQFVNVITGSVGYLLMMSGHEKDLRNLTFFAGLFSIILNLVLVKFYSAFGAAIAIAVASAIQNLVAVKMVRKRLGFNTMLIYK